MSERRTAQPVSDPDLLRVLMDHLPDLIYFKDLESRYLRINRSLAAGYGLDDPAKAVGRSDADFYPKEFARATRDMEAEIIRTGEPRIDVEEKVVWPDGRMVWVSATKMPLRDPAGKVVGTFGVSRDISHLKQAQEEVRRSERLYRSLVDNLPQNFLLKDREGRLLFGNRAYCATVGRPLKELLGKTDHDLFPPELARKYCEDDARVMQTGVTLDTVEAHKSPGKPVVYVRVVKVPFADAEGRVVGVQGIFWEVPAEKA